MKFLYVILALSLTLSASAQHIIVSDFDDTIRHTNAASTSGMIWNLLMKRKKVFSGMPELLNTMKSQSSGLKILTGSPDLIRGKVKKTLTKNQIDYDELITKDTKALEARGIIPQDKMGKPATYYFKIHHLTEILMNYPNQNLLLLGDDAGGDPEVFKLINDRFPGRIEAIYIRAIKNRPVPLGMKKFVTAYEVANFEVLAGRFDRTKLSMVFKAVVEAKKFRTTIPNFAYCPSSGFLWKDSEGVRDDEFSDYVEFINRNCELRRQKQANCKE